jgi:hypothetical protein
MEGDSGLRRARWCTVMSASALVGSVTAVAARQPPALVAPLGVAAVSGYAVARASLRGGATRRRVDDRSYAVAYPIAALAALVGLFVAFVAVHEGSVIIGESVIHAAYWAALGVAWLLPVAVQAWRRYPRTARVLPTLDQRASQAAHVPSSRAGTHVGRKADRNDRAV